MKKTTIFLMVTILLVGAAFAQLKTPNELKLQESENVKEFVNESTRSLYCDGTATDLIDEWISNVNFAGIDNTSGSTGYSDFTAFTAEVTPGGTYPITVTITNGTATSWIETVRVWIDWNQDAIWEIGESYDIGIYEVPANSSLAFNSSVTVPLDAVAGSTRMRIGLRWSIYLTDPCLTYAFGEVEDYSVNVLGSPQVPLSNYALYLGIFLIVMFTAIRFRRMI